MENFIIYIAKASGLLILFFLAYYFLLRKETFFTSNRWFLLTGLITSALLPLVEYTKIIWVNPTPVQTATQTIDFNQLILMQQLMENQPKETITINWFDLAAGMYLAGVLLFLARFIYDLISVRKILKGTTAVKDEKFKLIDSTKVASPFSFFNYIVYNSEVLEPEELNSIISHEKVHSSQKHSLDMIISQLFCIAFWFNPFAWKYKKSISQNLEFIADSVAIKQLDDKKAYQKTLLKITMQPNCIAITNHFYQSLIKKRIVMLNKKQSNRLNSWKYITILPVLAAFLLLFQVKVIAQEKETEITSTTTESLKIAIEVNKDTKDEELAKETKVFKDEFDADAIISDLQRNESGEITAIKVTVKDKNQSRVYQVSGNKPITPFTITLEKNNGSDENYITFTGTNMRTGSESYTMSSTAPYPPVSPMAPPAAPHMLKAYRLSDNDSLISPVKKTQIKNLNGALLVINGAQQSVLNDEGDINLPNGQQISSMTVLSSKEAKKKYGKQGKKGAIEITTKKNYAAVLAPQDPSYVYSYGYGDIPMPPMPEMDMDMIMQYANNGVDIGMRALENFNWNDAFDDFEAFENFESLSPEEMDRIKDAMENAKIEVRKTMSNAETQKAIKNIDRAKLKKAFGKDIDKKVKAAKARNEMEEARNELEQAREELLQAKKELEKARKELIKKQSK